MQAISVLCWQLVTEHRRKDRRWEAIQSYLISVRLFCSSGVEMLICSVQMHNPQSRHKYFVLQLKIWCSWYPYGIQITSLSKISVELLSLRGPRLHLSTHSLVEMCDLFGIRPSTLYFGISSRIYWDCLPHSGFSSQTPLPMPMTFVSCVLSDLHFQRYCHSSYLFLKFFGANKVGGVLNRNKPYQNNMSLPYYQRISYSTGHWP